MMPILPLERSHLEANRKIELTGVIQGVGFRPFVYQLARRYGLRGFVQNSCTGVTLEVEGKEYAIEAFLEALQDELPPLARIDRIESRKGVYAGYTDFQILQSKIEKEKHALIPPDIATCDHCLEEMNDPANRRYHYPFINCTDCGPRYSIIETVPYDRPNTSMRFFSMCEACKAEYTDPTNRRYHAQPIGCWECGPCLSLWDKNEELRVKSEELIGVVSQLILGGNIVAVKGVGGYHLVCDATNDEAVQKMRERKRRPSKPYAVMVADIAMALGVAKINAQEKKLLLSKERPIVLLDQSKNQNPKPKISQLVAPNLSRIGLFLPYTPLHVLLLKKLNRPLVATSANVTDEPLCTDRESLEKLSGVYDCILDHDRRIVNGCDDSVVMVVKGQTIILRRARGYAPSSIKLPFRLSRKVLALGANQKSTIAIGFDNEAILSPHIGDLDTIDSIAYFEKNIQTLERIYDFKPDIVLHDLHPNYESTKYALVHYQNTQGVQHHYAHILGVMAEKQLTGKVLGVAFDGTGYGDDKVNGIAREGALGYDHLWGGEFLICDPQGYERVAHFDYFKLLGGDKAIREPRRVALSLLFDCFGREATKLDSPAIRAFTPAELKLHYQAWQKGLNAPLTSSTGRLFDAVASLTGVCQVMSFEGESGMLLEELYDASVQGVYPFSIEYGKISFLKMIEEITMEPDVKVAVSKFFHTLVEIIYALHQQVDLPLVLSGGVFQNRVLLELVLDKIPDAILPNEIPPNDGGIALGQVMFGLNEIR
ncbi:MAG: carbamoyltransferase HypF [Campylobacterota bacterium]|nr:carbamoyltransferase HypF [Campylobacterota bacterium]